MLEAIRAGYAASYAAAEAGLTQSALAEERLATRKLYRLMLDIDPEKKKTIIP